MLIPYIKHKSEILITQYHLPTINLNENLNEPYAPDNLWLSYLCLSTLVTLPDAKNHKWEIQISLCLIYNSNSRSIHFDTINSNSHYNSIKNN